MIGVVVITHGSLASGLVEAAEMILGSQEMVRVVIFSRSEGQEDLAAQMTEALEEMTETDGAIVLTDMKGGSAYTVSRMLMGDYRFQLITGVNLPILLEVFILRKENPDFKEVASLAAKKGQGGIAHLEK